jgi:hypothetical protein
VERIEPRCYRQPLITDGGLEKVEVEGSIAAQCSMVRTEHRDAEAAWCLGGTVVEQRGVQEWRWDMRDRDKG